MKSKYKQVKENFLNRLPFVSRKERDKEIASLTRIAYFRQEELSKQQAEWKARWEPMLQKMLKISARRDPMGGFVLNVALERQAMEMAASYNDQRYWAYVSDMLAHHFKRQLSTMNFAGLHRLAMETEDRIERNRIPYAPRFE